MTLTALAARDLRKTVKLPGGQPLEILRGIDFVVRAGESVAVMGRSGSGKTTLLAALGLLSPIQHGQIFINGQETTDFSDRRRAAFRNHAIGFVFQSYSLVHHLTAYGNVELALRYGKAMARKERRRRTTTALELVDLLGRARSKPRHLSGGEQQRVAIARALVREPAVMLADEPTGALDTETAEQVLTVLLDATRSRGCALVVVTHDTLVAGRMGRTVHLLNGRLEEQAR